ncbi:MAG: hypothetical protein HUJ65_03060 [Oscillospiraceae bacterium]|nr:hypothetical protein [Oscillospiraceae bacterium]
MGKAIIINAEDVPKQDSRDIPWMCKFDGTENGTQNFYSVHWNMPQKRIEEARVGHPPHMHKENEIIMLIGVDPENHGELGAEVELCIGEDMEKYVFTKTCTIIIPGGTPHGNFHVVEAKKPWIFVQIQEAASRTEKFLWEYLTDEEKATIEHPEFWQDVGY